MDEHYTKPIEHNSDSSANSINDNSDTSITPNSLASRLETIEKQVESIKTKNKIYRKKVKFLKKKNKDYQHDLTTMGNEIDLLWQYLDPLNKYSKSTKLNE